MPPPTPCSLNCSKQRSGSKPLLTDEKHRDTKTQRHKGALLKKPWMRAFVPLCLCASVSFGTRFGFEPSGHCKITHPVYCPHAGHKKNAGPVVPAGQSGHSSLLLFSDYPAVPNADISCPDTFSVTRTALHNACQETEGSPESRSSARLHLSDGSNTRAGSLSVDCSRQ